MHEYTVRQLAELAGISIRTLHHYDAIRLLVPRMRTAAGHRVYGEAELLRLQQILFCRELDMSLNAIARILDAPGFDPVVTLERHRAQLEARVGRVYRLLENINTALARYAQGKTAPVDRTLFAGFSEEPAAHRRDARKQNVQAPGAKAEGRLQRRDKVQRDSVTEEGDAIIRRIAGLMNESPESENVQAAVADHHAWLERNFYTASAELYEGLGRMYAANAEFRARYDGYKRGLADFLCAAMRCHARNVLAQRRRAG